MTKPLLEVQDLEVTFATDEGFVRAVDGVSFTVMPEQTLGVVGESGSGKSVTFLAIMGLLDRGNVRVSGRVLFKGTDLLALSEKEWRAYRAERIGMIFQDSLTGLNPVQRVGNQIAEVEIAHRSGTVDASRPWVRHKKAKGNAVELLRSVGVADPESRARQWPHQFSGGMRQRAMIAMAMSLGPELLIADEPTTALDVTVQAQILELIDDLKRRCGSAVVLITHDLGVVAEHCHDVMVMYAGKSVESGESDEIFARLGHPYTRALLRSMGRLDQPKPRRLETIGGQPPSLARLPTGCAFHPRCPFAMPICRVEPPPLQGTVQGHHFTCHVAGGVAKESDPSVSSVTISMPSSSGDVIESSAETILMKARGLTKYFSVRQGGLKKSATLRAVDGIDLDVRRGRNLGTRGRVGLREIFIGSSAHATPRTDGRIARIQWCGHSRERSSGVKARTSRDTNGLSGSLRIPKSSKDGRLNYCGTLKSSQCASQA